MKHREELIRAPWPVRAMRRATVYACTAAAILRCAEKEADPMMRVIMRRRAKRNQAKAARVRGRAEAA